MIKLARDLELHWWYVRIPSRDVEITLTPSFLMTFFGMWALYWLLKLISLFRRLLFWRRTPIVGFFPNEPNPWHQIWNVSRWSGVRFSNDISKCDALYYFEDRTDSTLDPAYYSVDGMKTLNERCTDISKTRVMQVFEQVFGYNLEIDPLTYQGEAVCKSDINAAHDGRVVQCPITEREDGVVYQKLVRNSDNGTTVIDLRAVVLGPGLPIIYLKERDISMRFENSNTTVDLAKTSDYLSEEELAKLVEFCDAMGLDVGGIDILRDRPTGLIYVVDVNKTCMGPPVALPFFQKLKALHIMGREWRRLLIGWSPKGKR